jgi:class 3 adenylate cyclase/tetratricopeptide (TPR) repeat protein
MQQMADYNSVLTLLRSGALEQAEKEYHRLALDTVKGEEDILALGGRLLKTKALEQTGEARGALAYEAGLKYHEAYRDTGGTYTGINTAALYLVGGNETRAFSLAKEVLQKLERISPNPGEDAYYHMATVAEAHLILSETGQAQSCLGDALQLDPHNYEAHATTLKQFEMILAARDMDAGWLDALRPPKALHFAGHIFGVGEGKRPMEARNVYALERLLEQAIAAEKIGFAYGALAAGSDIMIAEILLEQAVDFHLVLPCPDELFIATSVAPFGADWVAKFHKCREAATTVRYVSSDPDVTDDLRMAFASELSMGLASLKAQRLATEAVQLLVWDEKIPKAEAGTARDALHWSRCGRRQIIVPYPEERTGTTPSVSEEAEEPRRRGLKAMLFADVRGFGALSDHLVPVFLDTVLAPLAEELKKFGHKVNHVNTWGDGLFVVFSSVEDAAAAAIDLQGCFHACDLKAAGLPEFLALRVGGHYGPILEKQDAFLGKPGYFGNEVSYAARIEPMTVPGSIYVSEAFACALAVGQADKYRSESVGAMTPRKGVDPIKLFSLRKI